MNRGASLSVDGCYRWVLERQWADGTRCTFIMLNPSTADGEQDDPTIRRCIGFAQAWGHGRLAVVNLYAWRATKPHDLWDAADWGGMDVIGDRNDQWIEDVCAESSLVVCAWGNHGAGRGRADSVTRRLRDLGIWTHALKISAIGQPCHPLYLAKTLVPFAWPDEHKDCADEFHRCHDGGGSGEAERYRNPIRYISDTREEGQR